MFIFFSKYLHVNTGQDSRWIPSWLNTKSNSIFETLNLGNVAKAPMPSKQVDYKQTWAHSPMSSLTRAEFRFFCNPGWSYSLWHEMYSKTKNVQYGEEMIGTIGFQQKSCWWDNSFHQSNNYKDIITLKVLFSHFAWASRISIIQCEYLHWSCSPHSCSLVNLSVANSASLQSIIEVWEDPN